MDPSFLFGRRAIADSGHTNENPKPQIPNPKSQSQDRNPNAIFGIGTWDLELGIWDLGFGIWDLLSNYLPDRPLPGFTGAGVEGLRG
jgi:hypothetical protein